MPKDETLAYRKEENRYLKSDISKIKSLEVPCIAIEKPISSEEETRVRQIRDQEG